MKTYIEYEEKQYPFEGYDFVGTEHGPFLDYLSHHAASTHSFFELGLLEKIRNDASYLHVSHTNHQGVGSPKPEKPLHIVDIGANLGNHSLFFSEVMQCNVTAFEPVPATFAYLEKNVPKATCHNVALGAVEGEMGAAAGMMESTDGKLNMANMGGIRLTEGTGIQVKTLDSYKLTPDLIKIDVEGMELDVLKGARETLETTFPDVWLECEDMKKFADIWEYMKELGYSLWDTDNSENVMLKFQYR